MNDLISLVVIDQEPRVDSRLIADQLGVKHINTRELIEQYLPDFEEFGKARFQTEASGRTNQPQKFYLLNEDQAYLLLTYSQNTPHARALKIKLVKAFSAHRQAALSGPQPQNAVLAAQLAQLLQGKVLVDYETLRDLANIPFAMRHLVTLVEGYATQIEQQIGQPLLNRLAPAPTRPLP